MRVLRFGVVLLCCAIILSAVFAQAAVTVSAQNAQTCSVISADDLKAATTACASTAKGAVCLGTVGVKAQFSDTSNPTFIKPGDQVDLAKVTLVSTSVTDQASGNAGVALLKLQTGTAADDPSISAVLFGESTLTSKVNPAAATMPTLAATTAGGDLVLLRGGASPNYPATLKLTPGQTAVVDGRTKAGDWLRVRLDVGVGWARAVQLKVTGDISALKEMGEQDTQADFLYSAPMQAFTLSANPSTGLKCGSVQSGLLIQSSADKPVRLLVNGVDVTLTSATVLVRATAKDHLELAVLAGKATAAALGNSSDLVAGQWVRVKLGGTDGLMASAPVSDPITYTFAAVDGVPTGLLSTAVSCTVGLATSDAKTIVRVGPGQERGSLFFMKPEANYPVSGQANDAAGAPWWQIKVAGTANAWVQQSTVHNIGACDQIAKVAAPPVIAAVPSGDTGGGSNNTSGQPASPGFAPTTRTIWQADPGPINSTGTCSGVPAAYCSQLVAITPSGSGLLWKGQELKPYYMTRVRENVYSYAGPNILGDARIQLTVAFTSQTTFKATQIMVMNSQVGCTYSYSFAGTFLR